MTFMREKRRQPRRHLNKSCWVLSSPHGPPIQARIQDISRSGARIRLKSAAGLPDTFTLVLTADYSVKRKCRMAWISGKEIGLTFENPK
jgi:hypothetical protein